MPQEGDHVALANRNHDTLYHLLKDPEKYSEWIATVAFYKALQVVEAMFAKASRSKHDHSGRHDSLKTLHPDIWKHYRPLWQASCIARYLHDNDTKSSYRDFSSYIAPDEIEEKLINKRLRSIERIVVGRLSEVCRTTLKRVPEANQA